MRLLGETDRESSGAALRRVQLGRLTATTALLTVALASPALAQATHGGAGGLSNSNGGTSSATATGSNGDPAPLLTGGGGGGGAGVIGGVGSADVTGHSAGGTPGLVAGDPGHSGQAGGTAFGGGGGGGGAHGAVIATDGSNSAAITGGYGGKGGSAGGVYGSGGGGAGGYGVVVDGGGLTYTNSGAISAGRGGDGGAATGNGRGGDGGGGGYGVYLTGPSVLVNSGSINGGDGGDGGDASVSGQNHAGGDGGAGGAGVIFAAGGTLLNSGSITGGAAGAAGTALSASNNGVDGRAGDGVSGANLTVINSGTISAGLNPSSYVTLDGNAITFTGGSNVLEIRAGSIINGNVVGTGTDALRLGGTTDASFDVSTIGASAQYQGFSSFVKTGSSTWRLTGSTTAVTPWSINQGTLAVASDASLGDTSGGLSLDGGTLQFLAGFSSARAITLNAGGGIFDTNGYNALLGGVISGPGGLTKNGAGTLSLMGSSTYTGATTINAGTLQAAAANVFASASAFTLAAGAVLDLNGYDQTIGSLVGSGDVMLRAGTLTAGADNTSTTYAGTMSGTGGFTKAGTGTMTLAGANSYSGATTINGGTLRAGASGAFAATSAFTVGSGAVLDLGGIDQTIGSLAGAGSVLLGAATLTAGGDNGSTVFSGTMSGSGGFIKVGTGTQTLAGTSSYTGPTAVNAGTLHAGAANAFASSSAFAVASGATLDLGGYDQTIGSLSGAGNVVLGAGTLTAGGDNSSTVFSGSIYGSGGFTKAGTGTMKLTGVNGYTGATTISGGTLQAGSYDSFAQSSAVTVTAGATLDLNGYGQIIGSLAGSGRVLLGSGTLSVIDNGSSTVFSGTMSGSGGLYKDGSGTLTLAGITSYAGQTVLDGGTLRAGIAGAFSSASAFVVDGVLDLNNFDQTIGSLSGGGAVLLGSATLTAGGDGSSTNFGGTMSGTGGFTKVGAGTMRLLGINSYTGATHVDGGRLQAAGFGVFASSSAFTVASGATLDLNGFDQSIGSLAGSGSVLLGTATLTAGGDDSSTVFSGTMSGSGGFTKAGAGTMTFAGSSSYAGATLINGGTIRAGAANAFAASSAYTLASGTVLDLNGFNQTIGSLAGSGSVLLGAAMLTAGGDNSSTTFTGVISGSGGFTKTGTGTMLLGGSNSYTGPTIISGGVLQAGAAGVFAPVSAVTIAGGAVLDLHGTDQTIGSLAGSGSVLLGAAMLTAGGDNGSTTFAGSISGSGGLTKAGSGRMTLTGTSSYTGATVIDGGVLDVAGAITNTSGVTVNAGGTLMGGGLIDPPLTVTINNGGTLAPGNGSAGSSMTIVGNLALQSGAIYQVQLDPTTASFASITGTASLGGATVNAVFANGAYVDKRYTILTAAGGISGSFGTLVNTNLPHGFRTSLSTGTNDVTLSLDLVFALPGAMSGNQQAVGNALSSFFDRTGSIPLVFGTLTGAALTQASGESGTAAQQGAFVAMSQFASLLIDPFAQRQGGGALGYAEVPRKRTDAFAMVGEDRPASFAQRWNVWAAGFGGAQTTSGNAVLGSNDTTGRLAGTAVGADYRLSPQTLAGFALAGGGTNYSVNGLGSGRSDLFQAGAYLRHEAGPAYLAAALAYGWQDVTSERTVTISGVDRLRGAFQTNAWTGRLEAGSRLVVPRSGGLGLTPYAAAQVTTVKLPDYAEQVVSGASTFALSYAGKTMTDTRSELGLRSDKSFVTSDGVLTLRGRLAWAHDFNPDRSLTATFQALPGASFVVNGAAPARDSALTTTALEMSWLNGWSASASFEGEFSPVTRSFAGKGGVRYAW